MNAFQKKAVHDAHEMMEELWGKIRAKRKGDVFDYLGTYIGHIIQMVYVTVESEADKATAVEILNELFSDVTENLEGTGVDVACMVKE
jgi:hypothetical protein